MTEVIRPIETKLDQKYLENAIEEKGILTKRNL